MSFDVKPLSDIKRILLNETVNLLKYHQLIDADYTHSSDKPDATLFKAISKLDKPRNTQVEFLWKLLDDLDTSTTLGFSKDTLTDNKRARCFTGIALAILDQISKTYTFRDPSASNLYNGLRRAVGLILESEKDTEVKLDNASKLSLVGYAHKYLMPYIYENASLEYVREETPFSSIKKLDLHELFNTVIDLNHNTSLEAHKSAKENTEVRAEQKVQHAKEKAKVEQHSKSIFRMFSGSVPENPSTTTPTTNPSSKKGEKDEVVETKVTSTM
ncbi:Uncharacterised protein [Legionella busanensis]|uniref:Dot/Icm T4SS effector n=1 Tax=Legionella busanensis TaxID=190655 RepID=A0A378JQT0_9GAMM|nr:hypothetical protein [Legionella busanensis]STX52260.1 Uncharacterised protein [Legionella busanensis]